jgi:hypothetical protein
MKKLKPRSKEKVCTVTASVYPKMYWHASDQPFTVTRQGGQAGRIDERRKARTGRQQGRHP